jgi:hypothetical protein
MSIANDADANAAKAPLHDLHRMGWPTLMSYEPAVGPVDWQAHGLSFLHWIISGGESGINARATHPDWHRATRDFCLHHRIAYFFKQWGEWTPIRTARPEDLFDARKELIVRPDGGTSSGLSHYGDDAFVMRRVGKKAAGRLLDGVEHNDLPQ